MEELQAQPKRSEKSLSVYLAASVLVLFFAFVLGSYFVDKRDRAEEAKCNALQEKYDESIRQRDSVTAVNNAIQAKFDTLLVESQGREAGAFRAIDSIHNENENIQAIRTVDNDKLVNLFKDYRPN